MNFGKNIIFLIAGILVGAAGGFFYWYYIGCTSGSCAITSIWYRSTIYGSVMGGLLASMLYKEKKGGKND